MAEKLFCSGCEQEKDTSEFYRHKRNKNRGYTYKCKTCISDENKQRYADNAEAIKQKSLESYHRNKPESKPKTSRERLTLEERLEKSRMYHRTSYYRRKEQRPDYHNGRQREWKKQNSTKIRVTSQRRRAIKKQAEGSFTQEEWQRLCQDFDYKCLCCGESKPLTFDHIVPLTKGGSNYISNIQPLCLSCNSSKKTKTIDYRPFIPDWIVAG